MPITLKKQAFTLPGPQTVKLTPEECQELYAGAEPVYDYAPVGAKDNPAQWDTINWKTFEAQFTQLCDQLEKIREDGVLFFTEKESGDEKNKKLYKNQVDFLGRYKSTIETFTKDVLFHTMNKNSRYTGQLGNPLFFEDIKNALEVIVLRLQADVKKLKESDPYDIADKASALKLFDEAVREASACDEGAHTKLVSLRQDIRTTKGVQNLVALQLDGVFTRMGSRYTKRAREQNLGWNLAGYETHAAFTIKNWAQVKGIFPKGMPYVEDRFSSRVTKLITRNEDGSEVTLFHVPDANPIGFTDVDLNQHFQPEFDALFNTRTVVAHLADHLAGNIDAMMGDYESALRKANEPAKINKAKNTLMDELSGLMEEVNLEHQAGFFERVIPIPQEDVDEDYWLTDYQRKSPLEVYYWAQVYACKALEKEGLVEGLERQELAKGLVLVSSGVEQWFEDEKKELIPLAEVIKVYGLEKNLARLNHIKTFGLVHALMGTAPEGQLKEALKAKRKELMLPYNFSQLGVDRPYFCFESIEDLFALKEACKENLYFFCLALEKAPRSMMQAFFYKGLTTDDKTKIQTKKLFYDLNISELPRELAESGIPLKREDLSIYISEAFLDFLMTSSEFEAEDSVPGAWLGQPPKKIPQKFWAMRDYPSIREHFKGSLGDLFALYPPMIDRYFEQIPAGQEAEALAAIIISSGELLTAKLIQKIRDFIQNNADQHLSLLDSVGTHRGPLIDDLFEKLREIPAEGLVDYIPRVKSPVLYDKMLELLKSHENHAEFVKRRKGVIDDFNVAVCMNPENKNRLVIKSFEDVLTLWNRVEDKGRVIDAMIVLLSTTEDQRIELSRLVITELLSETHSAIAKTIIDEVDLKNDSPNQWTVSVPYLRSVIEKIFERFKTSDELFAHLPMRYLSFLTPQQVSRLITDLRSLETYLQRSRMKMCNVQFSGGNYLGWVKTPNDMYAVIGLVKNIMKDDQLGYHGIWDTVFNVLKDALSLVTFPGLRNHSTSDNTNVSKLKDKMIDAVFDLIVGGKGSAEALLMSWGLSWEGEPSLDEMFTSQSPYFDVYRAVHHRVNRGLNRVGLLAGYDELLPFSSDEDKKRYNQNISLTESSRLYLALDTIEDIEAIEPGRLDLAYRPPIQRILSAGMLNTEKRSRCEKILTSLRPAANRYLTQEYLDHAINTRDFDLIPNGFHLLIPNVFVEMSDYKEIVRNITLHSARKNWLQCLIEIHPGIVLRYLTNVPEQMKSQALFDVLKALTKITDREIIDQAHALIKTKLTEIQLIPDETVNTYNLIKSDNLRWSKREYRFLVAELMRAHPDQYGLGILTGRSTQYLEESKVAGHMFLEEYLMLNPIRSEGDLRALSPFLSGLPGSYVFILLQIPSIAKLINRWSADEIFTYFTAFKHIDQTWDYVLNILTTQDKKDALRVRVLNERKDAISFTLYDDLLSEYYPADPANDPIVQYRETKKKQINALEWAPGSVPLIILDNFDDIFLMWKRLSNWNCNPAEKKFEIYRNDNSNIPAVGTTGLLEHARGLTFFTLKNFLESVASAPAFYKDYTNQTIAHLMISWFQKGSSRLNEIEGLSKIPWVSHNQLLNDSEFMKCFRFMSKDSVISIVSAITQDEGYKKNETVRLEFISGILHQVSDRTLMQLTTPPVPEHLLLGAFLGRLVSPSKELIDHMLPKLEEWIGNIGEKSREDLFVLNSIPARFDHFQAFDSLDYLVPYHRAYLRAVIVQNFRQFDPRFELSRIDWCQAVNVFHDPDTDFYIDLPMKSKSHAENWRPHFYEFDLESNAVLPQFVGNPFWQPPGHPGLMMTTMQFIERYIEHPDFKLIYRSGLPALEKRFEDQIKKQIAVDPDYAEAVLVPVLLQKFADLIVSGWGRVEQNIDEARSWLRLLPAEHPAYSRLSDFLTMIHPRITPPGAHARAQADLSRFFTLVDRVPPALCKRIINKTLLEIIKEKLDAVPGDKTLRKQAFNFLLTNKKNYADSDIDDSLLYLMFVDAAENVKSANEAFLLCCSEKTLDDSALTVLASMVRSDNLESILNAIDVDNWGYLLVQLGLVSPGDEAQFLHQGLHDLEPTATYLHPILRAYEVSRPRTDRLKHLMKMDAGDPEFIHQLRHFCEHNKLTKEQTPQVKKLFAKHFGEVYKQKMSGQAAGQDAVTRAILNRPPRI
jgi:hypothetical protein